jgi:hypothetical protein
MKALIVVAFLLYLGGALAWAKLDDAEKQKKAQAATVAAQNEVETKAAQARINAEEQRKADLASCLYTADSNYYELAKRNGHYNPKTNLTTAPVWVWQAASNQRATDVSECQIQYGGR